MFEPGVEAEAASPGKRIAHLKPFERVAALSRVAMTWL